ncbi:hypothetical protein D3C85_1510900 [compost metagenome]
MHGEKKCWVKHSPARPARTSVRYAAGVCALCHTCHQGPLRFSRIRPLSSIRPWYSARIRVVLERL